MLATGLPDPCRYQARPRRPPSAPSSSTIVQTHVVIVLCCVCAWDWLRAGCRATRATCRVVTRVIWTRLHLEQQEALDATELESLVHEAEEEEGREAEQAILKNRSPEDLEWERQHLTEMLSAIQDLSGHSSKMLELLGALEERRIKGTGRIRQTVVFTRFLDTLTEIVDTLRQVHPDILLGTYSGKGSHYTDFETKRLLGIDREEVLDKVFFPQIPQKRLMDPGEVAACALFLASDRAFALTGQAINFAAGWVMQ